MTQENECETFIRNLSQAQYAFNDTVLTSDELYQIKKEANDNRSAYGMAPIGSHIFSLIEQNRTVFFQLQKFSSPDLDAMIIRYRPGSSRKYIVINSEKPLINQIFAAAHEYYHYLYSFQHIHQDSIICDFNRADDREEIKANRFAAEFLLPQAALENERDVFFRYINTETFDSLPIEKQAVFLFNLTIKYSLPLKAVLYRLREENICGCIDDLMNYYPVLKKALLSVFCDSVYVKELYSNENRYISGPLYQLLPVLYENGRIDGSDVEKIVKQFSLDSTVINKDIKIDETDTLSDPAYKMDVGNTEK